jgi:murein DD-endopeptidase MepM/ murein hydrolase activator NlpD
LRSLKPLFFAAFSLLSITAASAELVIARKPGPFPDGMDTWLPKNGSAQHDSGLRVGILTGVEDISLVRFDLSGLPQVATRAYLWLYANGYSGTTPTAMNVSRVSSQWHAGKVTWASQPASVGWLSAIAPTPGGWYRVDVTPIYNQWRSAAYTNYGLKFAGNTTTNSRFNLFSSSGATAANRPELNVYYNPQANDKIIKLKWPLATSYATRVVPQGGGFGSDWAGDAKCNGLIKKHNGTDFRATPGTVVYAAEDGIIKEVLPPSSAGWASNIVLEHNHPIAGKFTTVYWHVVPVADVSGSNPGGFVPKGMQIATIADLSSYQHGSHFHFGLRIGSYAAGVSGTGALPQTNCGGYPAFPAGFLDPNSSANIIFQ